MVWCNQRHDQSILIQGRRESIPWVTRIPNYLIGTGYSSFAVYFHNEAFERDRIGSREGTIVGSINFTDLNRTRPVDDERGTMKMESENAVLARPSRVTRDRFDGIAA